MAEQQRNFRGTFAQWRHVDRQHIEAVVQILPESPRLHRVLNVHVGRRQYAHVGIDQVAAAEARVLMILQNMQELGLQVRGHLRDFVQENGALVGQFKFAGLGAHRAGERALFESETVRTPVIRPGSAAQFTLINGWLRLFERR